MKHIFSLAIALAAGCANAQVQNGGFEALNSAQEPLYWKWISGPISISIDTSGVPDSIAYPGGRYTLNTIQVHTGLYAMEIGNGFNFTTNTPCTGRLAASYDTIFTGGFPIDQVLITARPQAIRFFAAYFPEADDSAYVEVEVSNASYDVIGTGTLRIGGTVATYTEFILPITYTATDSAAIMRLAFHTATPGGTASFNTRFLIDDVSAENTQTGFTPLALEEHIAVYPNPATDHLTLDLPASAHVLDVRLIDGLGRASTVPFAQGRIALQGVAPGRYTLLARTSDGVKAAPLVVVR
ncbi:MAG: T9SS type A sorting domain-containing protein [Flavobacteriales bacterium]|nr:T9SS type A sorting domain-containing protein [Flavobacteriales bacterium]